MKSVGEEILACLTVVAAERQRRQLDATLGSCTTQMKVYQLSRFAETYSDMLVHEQYGPAARFFLDDLYGPGDFSQRDEEFARIVPALVRLFPREIVDTVHALAQLHALSEQLDSAMGEALKDIAGHREPTRSALSAELYGRLWRQVGQRSAREQQVVLMLQVGQALATYTRKPLLRQTLRLMRVPAQAAGLGSLQTFLERGFDTFRQMRGSGKFLNAIAAREREFSANLFAG